MNTLTNRRWIQGLVTGCLFAAYPVVEARDLGVNQPGLVGNPRAREMVKDPGINQPGRLGNTPLVSPRDPGVNQPGAVGNVAAPLHRDPGINQPGAAGNIRR